MRSTHATVRTLKKGTAYSCDKRSLHEEDIWFLSLVILNITKASASESAKTDSKPFSNDKINLALATKLSHPCYHRVSFRVVPSETYCASVLCLVLSIYWSVTSGTLRWRTILLRLRRPFQSYVIRTVVTNTYTAYCHITCNTLDSSIFLRQHSIFLHPHCSSCQIYILSLR